MQLSYFSFALCCSLFAACSTVDPSFPCEETLIPELNSLQGKEVGGTEKVEVKPPYIVFQKTLSRTNSPTVLIEDSLYVTDAMHPASSLSPYLMDYYANSEMKRVYVSDSRIVFCYGYKKQIDFMDFKLNLINRVKYKFETSSYIDSKNQTDVNLSYVCSYLGKCYFYTLFWGASLDKYKSLSSQETFLEVYDLDGNPTIRYHLKGRHPVYFAVDEETFTLYGSGAYNDPENHLLVYKLKGLSRIFSI